MTACTTVDTGSSLAAVAAVGIVAVQLFTSRGSVFHPNLVCLDAVVVVRAYRDRVSRMVGGIQGCADVRYLKVSSFEEVFGSVGGGWGKHAGRVVVVSSMGMVVGWLRGGSAPG